MKSILMLIHTHTVDFSSFISSQTESAENSGHIKYIVQFIEKGKKKKKNTVKAN